MNPFDWRGPSSIFSTSRPVPEPPKPRKQAKEPYKRPRDPKPAYVPKTVWVTKPLADRIDFDAVRKYRLSGATWKECAKMFGTSDKALRERALEAYPELRTPVEINGGVKERPFPLADVVALIGEGLSMSAIAKKLHMGKATLLYKIKRTPEGREAHKLACERTVLRNNAGHPFGSLNIPTQAQSDRTNSIKGRM